MNKATFTFRVGKDLKDAFSAAAKDHNRSSAQLLRDLMHGYVNQQLEKSNYDTWLHAKVQKSQASANAGKLMPAEDVEAKFAARRTSTRRSCRLG
jgi:predicted transcriptional regulator